MPHESQRRDVVTMADCGAHHGSQQMRRLSTGRDPKARKHDDRRFRSANDSSAARFIHVSPPSCPRVGTDRQVVVS